MTAPGPWLWWLGALTALLMAATDVYTWSLEPAIPVLQFTFAAADFHAVLDRWGPEGVARFRRHFLLDFPLLVAYGLFGHLWVRHGRAFRALPAAARRWLGRVLPAAAVMDAAENLFHLYLVDAAAAPAALYGSAGLVGSLKWSLIALFILGAAVALLRPRPG